MNYCFKSKRTFDTNIYFQERFDFESSSVFNLAKPKTNMKTTIILFTLFTLASCLDYTDLENLGASCPLRDSCLQIPSSANFTHRSCECDRLCSVFRDCCIDADVPPTPRRYRNTRMHCMAFGSETDVGVYVVDRCPRNYAGSNVLRSKCETEDDFSDPMVSVPVTETLLGVTFKNRWVFNLCVLYILIGLNCNTSGKLIYFLSFILLCESWLLIKFVKIKFELNSIFY